MRVKIKKIVSKNVRENIQTKYGIKNEYVFYCLDEADQRMIIKTMGEKAKDSVLPGAEIEVILKEYNNEKFFQIDTKTMASTSGSYSRKPIQKKISLQEFDRLCEYVWKKALYLSKNKEDLASYLFDKMLGVASVVIDFEKGV